jgi:cytochrome c peroxidase
MKPTYWVFLGFVCCAAWSTAADQPPLGEVAPLQPLPNTIPAPADNLITPAKVALGKQLFFDPRLSGDNTMSCATCHLPDKAFGDGLAQSEGHDGKILPRNSPTLLNAAWHETLFWDGRAGSLEEQALIPIQAPMEMNQDLKELEHELAATPGYVKQFQAAFGSRATSDSIAKALAAFQRTLVTRPSPFDRYLQGDRDALTDQAKRGLELFVGEADCIRCHHGPLLSDGQFHRVVVSRTDVGREAVTGLKADRGKFRTPTLRNIGQTGPYMHDGSMQSLMEVVEYYFRGVPAASPEGLRLDVDPLLLGSYSDIPAIVAFLKSLSGEPPQITPPQLP